MYQNGRCLDILIKLGWKFMLASILQVYEIYYIDLQGVEN